MNFVQAIRSVFVNYFNFSGRASRSEYWFFYLFLIIADIGVDIADTLIFGDAEFAPINLIFFLGVLIPTVAVSVRRLHDIDRTGWWGLLLLTVVGLLVLLYWNLKPGDEGENRFGNNPLTLDGWETELKNQTIGVKGAIVICLIFTGILVTVISVSMALTAYNEYSLRSEEQNKLVTLPPEEPSTEQPNAP